MLSNDELGVKHVTLPILAVLMILGNGALILVTLRHKSLRNYVTNLLVASLALSDLLTGLVVVPLVVAAEKGRFGRSQYACLAVFCLTAAQLLASCLILEAIAIERFIAVVCPLRHHTLSTTRNACVLILGCWGYAMLIGAMPLAGWNVVDADDSPVNHVNVSWHNAAANVSSDQLSVYFGDCRFDTVVGASYVAFLYPGHFVPLCVIMLVVYIQVYLHSRGRRSHPLHCSYELNVRRFSVAMSIGTNRENETNSTFDLMRTPARTQENWRAMRVLVVLVGYFLVSWLPVVVWYCTLFRGFWVENARNVDPLLPVWFYNVSITLAYGNSAVNPFLYGFGNRSVRRCVLLTVRQIQRQRIIRADQPVMVAYRR